MFVDSKYAPHMFKQYLWSAKVDYCLVFASLETKKYREGMNFGKESEVTYLFTKSGTETGTGFLPKDLLLKVVKEKSKKIFVWAS